MTGELPFGLAFDAPPFRLSGTVYGVAVNHHDAIAALGDAVNAAPYRAAPRSVVLYVKPRNTFVDHGRTVTSAAEDGDALEAGAALAIVIGSTACAVTEAAALAHVAGYLVAADFAVAHEMLFRPQVRLKARDRSLMLSQHLTAPSAVADPDRLAVHVDVDGRRVHTTSTGGTVRGVARLVADISAFITLAPGDVVLAGVAPGAPRVRAGAHVAVVIDGVGRLEARVSPERES